jgi:hypothetical protein
VIPNYKDKSPFSEFFGLYSKGSSSFQIHNLFYTFIFIASAFSISLLNNDPCVSQCELPNYEPTAFVGNSNTSNNMETQTAAVYLNIIAAFIVMVVIFYRLDNEKSRAKSGINRFFGLGPKAEKSIEHTVLYLIIMVCRILLP